MPQKVSVPERDLLAAVLHRAIMDANSVGAAYNSEYMAEAREFLWLGISPTLLDIVFPQPMSFIWICHWLDVDWQSMRKAIASQIFIEPCLAFPSEVMSNDEPDNETDSDFDDDNSRPSFENPPEDSESH